VNYFYKPAPGVLGDAIPHYHEGRYHVFYLRDYRDPESYGFGCPWFHVSTADLVTYEEHGEALSRGGSEAQDANVATGAVFTDDAGLHHIFYTGMNFAFRSDVEHQEGVMHATSEDLVTWTKVEGQFSHADESMYERHDWRDPFVYRHPKTGRYNMLICARTRHGSSLRRGCTGLLTSDDLNAWKAETPFYAPHRFSSHECPDFFEMDGWYYLVFSGGGTTRYVMSRSADGPWVAPSSDEFDNRMFYAGKTASNGHRRFLFGWNATKSGRADDGDWEWGGCLTVHEVCQNADGTLAVRMPPEALGAFGDASPVRLDLTQTAWKAEGNRSYRVESPYTFSAAFGGAMPDTYLLEGEFNFERDAGAAGVLIGVDKEGEAGYFLRFNFDKQALQFSHIAGNPHWYVDHMPELDRPLALKAGVPVRYKVVVDKSAVVAYVDDRVALSARMYSALGSCGLFADGTSIHVSDFHCRALARVKS
jgi:beta-fructofuranosidase